MMSVSHTKGLIKELKPKLIEVERLKISLKNVIQLLTKDELQFYKEEINGIKSNICYATKKDQFAYCKEQIRDLLYRALAKRRGVKIINVYE